MLATAIAETSLTIEGVRVVIDSGQQRRAVFNPNSGMSRLVTSRVSKASAEQRKGRAGRIEPGVCYRLWSEAEPDHEFSRAACAARAILPRTRSTGLVAHFGQDVFVIKLQPPCHRLMAVSPDIMITRQLITYDSSRSTFHA